MLALRLDRSVLAEVFDITARAPHHMRLDKANVLTLDLGNLMVHTQFWPNLGPEMLNEDLEGSVADNKVFFLELTVVLAFSSDICVLLPSDQNVFGIKVEAPTKHGIKLLQLTA